jgi:Flp pilus assembly protein TadG
LNYRKRRRGSTILEFTLVGIPTLFVLISIFEIARGMWIYHTLAYAVKEGTRYAVVHGSNCAVPPNSCYVQIRDIAGRIQNAGVGLVPDQLVNVNFISATRTVNCPTLSACLQSSGNGATYWPALPPGSPGYPDVGGERSNSIEINAQYSFSSAIAMLWPGAAHGIVFPTFTFPGSSRERIQY